MNESISNAMVIMIAITVIGVCSGIVFFSLGYSKTYKIKSKVIDIIEKHGEYNDAEVRDEIEEYMKTAAYSSDTNIIANESCPKMDSIAAVNKLKNYRFCIYQHETIKGSYYTVKVYQTYHLPLIGDFINLRYSLTGDTKVIFSF